MTTMTDIEALGEIGWTNQIIYDKSGLVPGFWRPPYGDIDDRIRAIAHEVFGMYSVVWNRVSYSYRSLCDHTRTILITRPHFFDCIKSGYVRLDSY